MAAPLQDRNIKSDKWLSGLVDAMEDISAAEDICRAVNPAALGALLDQLHHERGERESRRFARLA